MKRDFTFIKLSLLLVFIFQSILTFAQTTIISPTGDGGFENGATFALNGWTVANYAATNTNKWFVGTAASTTNGVNAAYISNNASGTTLNYSNTASSRVMFYRDVVFPAGETQISLSFKLKVNGESNYDDLTVFIQNSATVPAVTQPASSTSAAPTITGATALATLSLLGTTYATRNYTITAAQAGNASAATTRRLIFYWENDASGGTQPPAAIDEISLISNCIGAVPTAATMLTTTTAQANWNALAGASQYEVRYKALTDPTTVATWTTPIVSSSTNTSITGLSASTGYEYQVRSITSGTCMNWSTSINFATVCNSVNLNLLQEFESGTTIPTCWTQQFVSGTKAFSFGTTTSAAGTSPNPAAFAGNNRLLFPSYSTTGNQTRLVTPVINTVGTSSVDVNFQWYHSSLGGATLYLTEGVQVQYSLDGTTWTNAGSLIRRYDATTAWVGKTLTLPALAGNVSVLYVGFLFTSNAGYDSYMDNIDIKPTPSCLPPTTLALSSITSTSANLAWTTSVSAPSSYEVYYSTTNTTPTVSTTPITTGLTGASTTLSGLNAATTYYLWMRSNCSGTYSDWTSVTTFTTLCNAVTNFTQNFDAGTTIPTCFAKIGTTGSASIQASSASSAPNCLYIYASSTTDLATFALQPVSNAGAGTHRLRFKARANITTAGVLQVGFLTNPTDPTTFTSIQSFTTTSTTVYDNFICNTGTSAGTNQTLAFRHTGSPANSILIDDIIWEPIPTCYPPTALTVTSSTTTDATLSWTAPALGTPSSYEIYYSTTNTAPTAATVPTVSSIAASPTTLAGLSPATTYYAWIRSNCGGGDISSWTTTAVTFTTSCVAFNIPYSQNFDTGVTTPALPNCTSQEDTNADNFKWVTATTNAISAPNAVQVSYNSTTTTVAMNDWFFTGGINLTAGTSYRLTFKYKGSCTTTYSEKLEVKYGTSATSAAMTSSAIFNQVGITTLANASVDFTPTSTGVYYIGFHGYSAANQCALVVDDILLDATPTCNAPTGLNAVATSSTDATLSWAAPALGTPASYEIYYSTTNTAPIAATTPTLLGVSGLTTSLTGLSVNTTYYAWIRSNCGGGDISPWTTTAVSFTTLCVSITTFPFTENFDAVTTPALPTCWSQLNANGDTDFWQTWSGYAKSGTLSAGLYTDFNAGANNDYLILPRMNITGGKRLRYWYRVRSATEPNDYRVVLSTTTPNAAGFTTTLLPLTTISNTTYQEQIIDLNAYTGEVYIAFHVPAGGLDGYYIYIDDVLVEDFAPCVGNPTASNTISSAGTSVCTGAVTTLSLSSVYPNSGISYQWESSAAGTSTFSPISGATNAAYTLTLTVATDYRCKITCANGGAITTSTPVSLVINAPTLCYCTTSLHSGFAPCITNVSFGTINNNTTGSGCSLPSYTAFPSTTTTMTLYKTVATPLNYTFDAAAIASVWIDYNRNGSFEASEWVQLTTSGTTGTVNITAPSTALVGVTGMRIRARTTAVANGPTDACTTFGSGETEDYQITIAENCINSANTTTAVGLVQLTDACEENGWTNYRTSGGPVLFAIEWEPAGSTSSNATAKSNINIDIYNEGAANNGLIYNSSLGNVKTVVTGYSWNVNLNGNTLVHPVNVRMYYPTAMITQANSVLAASGFTPITTSWFKTKDAPYTGSSMTNFFNPSGLDTTTTKVTLLTPKSGYPQVVTTVAGGGVSVVQFDGVTSFSGGSFAGTAGSATILPLTLTDFGGKTNEKINTLSWTTANEQNTLRFDIERSIDGVHFVKIGEVKASGNSNRSINYAFDDKHPLCNAYYRLLMLDKDGTSRNSQNVFLDRKCKNFVIANIFPNPTNRNTTIQFEAPEKMTVSIELVDMLGRTVLKNNAETFEGINTIELDLQKIPAGNYFVRLNNGENILQQKIIKQ